MKDQSKASPCQQKSWLVTMMVAPQPVVDMRVEFAQYRQSLIAQAASFPSSLDHQNLFHKRWCSHLPNTAQRHHDRPAT